MELQRVKVVNQTEPVRRTHFYVGESEIHGVRSVSFKQSAVEFPVFTFETIGLPEIDVSGDVQFSFTPETVQQAAVVLQNEFKNSAKSLPPPENGMLPIW